MGSQKVYRAPRSSGACDLDDQVVVDLTSIGMTDAEMPCLQT